METVKVYEDGQGEVEVVYIDGRTYATKRSGVLDNTPGWFLNVFNVDSLAKWLREKYGNWWWAGETREEHISLIGLGVMVGMV